jgi:hypothetical protein
MSDIKKTSDHNLKAKVVGKDPFFVSPPLQLEVSPLMNQHVTIKMEITKKNSPPWDVYPHTKLYFQFEDMDEFDENHYQSFLIRTYDKVCEYHFKIFSYYPTIIKRSRFDPINHPCSVEVSRFRIQRYQKHREPNFMDFKFPKVVLLLSEGRTGTTLLMQLLSLHKNITSVKDHPYEACILNYFMKFYELFKYAPHADEHNRDLAIINPVKEGGILPCPVKFQKGLDIAIFREEFRRFLASYLPKLFYCLEMDNLKTAKYYMEKWQHLSFELIFDVFPDAKVLALFRDPRNVFLSVIDFEHKLKYKAWTIGCPDNAALIRKIMEKVRYQLHYLDNDISSNQFISIRYEDIINRTTFTMKEISSFLDIPCDGNYLTKVVEHLHKDTQEYRQQRTTKNLEQSLYRYKSELSESDKEIFAEYKDLFERLNYDLE